LLYWLFFLEPAASIPTRWLVPVQAILTILYVSLFYLVFGWVFRLIRDRGGRVGALNLTPVLWTGMEAWRAAGELGFPWCLVGSAWLETPLRPWLATSGEIGLSGATVFTAAVLVALLSLHHRVGLNMTGTVWRLVLILGAAVLWLGLGWGAGWRAEETKRASALARTTTAVRIAAVQANVALEDKWQRAKIDSTVVPYTYLTQAAAEAGAQLVVWAETAVPAYVVAGKEPQLLVWLRQTARENNIFLYLGFPDAKLSSDGSLLRYNSSGLFGPGGDLIDRYAKHHLLPVGERMPFSKYLPLVSKLDMGQAEWTPGDLPCPLTAVTDAGELRFSGLICFESIFASLARHAVRCGAEVLVNITNDGWFGQTAGPRQHAALARLRGIECGVPLVRCANNGISYILDENGEFLASADLGERKFILAEVQPGSGGTLFVRTGALPLLIYLTAWTLLVLALFFRKTP
jgi:apolipoprotein N-acyltransferase